MISTLNAEVVETAQAVVVKISGEAKTDVSALERQFLRLLARRPPVVVLDLSELTFCSSLGMGSLMAFRRDITRCGSRLVLAAIQPLVKESFQRACLLPMFEVHDTLDHALGQS